MHYKFVFDVMINTGKDGKRGKIDKKETFSLSWFFKSYPHQRGESDGCLMKFLALRAKTKNDKHRRDKCDLVYFINANNDTTKKRDRNKRDSFILMVTDASESFS